MPKEYLLQTTPDHIRGNYGFYASTSEKKRLYDGGFEIDGKVSIQFNEQVTWLVFDTPAEFKSPNSTHKLITFQIIEFEKLFQKDHPFPLQNTLVSIVNADMARELTEKYGFKFSDSCIKDGALNWNAENFTVIGKKEIVEKCILER